MNRECKLLHLLSKTRPGVKVIQSRVGISLEYFDDVVVRRKEARTTTRVTGTTACAVFNPSLALSTCANYEVNRILFYTPLLKPTTT